MNNRCLWTATFLIVALVSTLIDTVFGIWYSTAIIGTVLLDLANTSGMTVIIGRYVM